MDLNLVRNIEMTLKERQTDELLTMLRERDRTQWSDEAFAAAENVLLARGILLPADHRADRASDGTAKQEGAAIAKEDETGGRVVLISSEVPALSELAKASSGEPDWARVGSTRNVAFRERFASLLKCLGILVLSCAILLGGLYGAKSEGVTSPFSLKGWPIAFLVYVGLLGIFVSLVSLAYMLFRRVMPKLDEPARCVKSFLSGIIDDEYAYSWACLGSKPRDQFPSPKQLARY